MGRITKVEVEYKELRSSGYPSFSNKTYGVQLRAQVLPEENYQAVRERLMEEAIAYVQSHHGDEPLAARLQGHPIAPDLVESAIRNFIAGTGYTGDVPDAAYGVMVALHNPEVLEVIKGLATFKKPRGPLRLGDPGVPTSEDG